MALNARRNRKDLPSPFGKNVPPAVSRPLPHLPVHPRQMVDEVEWGRG